MKALVLTGGGARGAFEAGVLYANKDAGWDIICGTSAGAINGAFAAQGMFDELRLVWSTIGARNVLQLQPLVANAKQFVTDVAAALHAHEYLKLFGALGELLKIWPLSNLLTVLGAIDPAPIHQILAQYLDYTRLRTTFVVTATNVTMRTADTFYWIPDNATSTRFGAKQSVGKQRFPITAANYVQVVQASTSIPGAFPPTDISPAADQIVCQYVDGGVANNTPLGMAIDAGADDITIVFMDPAGSAAPQRVTSLPQIGSACFDVMQSKILEDDIKLAQRTNQAVAGGTTNGRKPVTLRAVRPSTPLAVTVLDFNDQQRMDEAFKAGLAAPIVPL